VMHPERAKFNNARMHSFWTKAVSSTMTTQPRYMQSQQAN
jgi:hypothetical protein